VPPAVPADPAQALRARHVAQGLRLHGRTGLSGWLGERLDVGWALDLLHTGARHDAAVGESLRPAPESPAASNP
jgi:hypothetical protein